MKMTSALLFLASALVACGDDGRTSSEPDTSAAVSEVFAQDDDFDDRLPPRVTVEVSSLAFGCGIEISMVAYVRDA